jgi:5-methylcytosine-specific restriction endonuclease McrA
VTARRGTSNGNSAGSAEARRRRRAWLLETYRADVDVVVLEPDGLMTVPRDTGLAVPGAEPACRCYRCGTLLTLATLTVDRIVPGCRGGTYRRTNVRPACSDCNSTTGGAERGKKPPARRTVPCW